MDVYEENAKRDAEGGSRSRGARQAAQHAQASVAAKGDKRQRRLPKRERDAKGGSRPGS